jgi:hypothetical protein
MLVRLKVVGCAKSFRQDDIAVKPISAGACFERGTGVLLAVSCAIKF